MLLSILIWSAATIFAILSYPPLKESSEYRFSKTRLNIEGFIFLGSAILTVLVSEWFIALGIIGLILFKLKTND